MLHLHTTGRQPVAKSLYPKTDEVEKLYRLAVPIIRFFRSKASQHPPPARTVINQLDSTSKQQPSPHDQPISLRATGPPSHVHPTEATQPTKHEAHRGAPGHSAHIVKKVLSQVLTHVITVIDDCSSCVPSAHVVRWCGRPFARRG